MNSTNQQVQPWDTLPNPLKLPTITEQLQSVGSALRRQGANSKNRRTVLVGRDSIGVAIQQGDSVLVSYGKGFRRGTVDGIFLESSKGEPYQDLSYGYCIEPGSQELFMTGGEFDQSASRYRRTIQQIEPLWLGTRLGFLEEHDPWRNRDLPQGFVSVRLQSSKVRVDLGDHKSYLFPDQLIAFGPQLSDPQLHAAYRAARQAPLVPGTRSFYS